MSSPAYGGIMRQPATPPGSGPQAKVLDMSVPSHADVMVLHRRPGPELLRGDLALEGRPLPPPGAGDPAAGADLRDAVFKRITLRVHRQRLLSAAAVADPRGARGAAAREAAEGGGRRVRGPRARARRSGDGLRPRLALHRQAGCADLGGVGRGATPSACDAWADVTAAVSD